nr:hypothetical protein [Candidatus Sigynarchaeum springense]MDO8118360.1 hypothetical protein [Candidatus Sigynarchaeota archaeon]
MDKEEKTMQNLKTRFDEIGMAITLMPGGIPIGRGERSEPSMFAMDIASTTRGGRKVEGFRICPGDEKVDVHVIDTDKKLRQVVMFVREPERVFSIRVWSREKQRFVTQSRTTPGFTRVLLAGMDQSHLFIAELPRGGKPANTVKDAHRVLKPDLVHQRARETSRIKRQGEWFFIPVTPEEMAKIDEHRQNVVRKAGIGGRAGSHAHVAEELLEIDDMTFVRGSIRHPDHRPMELNGWFRVARNAEGRSSWIGSTGVRWFD